MKKTNLIILKLCTWVASLGLFLMMVELLSHITNK